MQNPSFAPMAPIIPDWPAPPHVKAFFSTRQGGCSQPPWDTLNLGSHVGDDPAAVARNRERLQQQIQAMSSAVASAPSAATPQAVFLEQVHGCETVVLDAPAGQQHQYQQMPPLMADAAVSRRVGTVCTIMVADCLPVLFAHRCLPVVAAAHAGWRGLAGTSGTGVLERCLARYAQTVAALAQAGSATRAGTGASPSVLDGLAEDTLVWLGPCIGPTAFEVGADVYQAFVQPGGLDTAVDAQAAGLFTASAGAADDRWLADLAGLARLRLQRLGLEQLHGNDGTLPWCTFSQPSRFFSHRRDAARLGASGRMAACIWLDAPAAAH
ncbi:laccase [Corticibacter populi]|uniref:Laccase n=1 Tax=Corticibacter populi TaxID=1550736 RepID=A0A3M6QZA3_9BURK|nr:polyphenol oxidase family protein [Corticibacter populi]RMX08340.1 laccase [Corticibacter populi]RZS35632.1 hypothetical protein EV687_0704 [Corticibacter populi]